MTLGGLRCGGHSGRRRYGHHLRTLSDFWSRAYALREAIVEGVVADTCRTGSRPLLSALFFCPMFLLSGWPRFLFVPLAEAVCVCDACQLPLAARWCHAGYVLLRAKEHGRSERDLHELQRGLSRFLSACANVPFTAAGLVFRRRIFIPSFLGLCLGAFVLVPFLGEDFFRRQTAGNSFFMSVALRECAWRNCSAFHLSRARFE